MTTPPVASSDQEKSLTDCRYFFAGGCSRGHYCQYRHSMPAFSNPVVCKFWTSGHCTNPSCAYRHPQKAQQADQPTTTVPPLSTRPCAFYFSIGCNKGSACPYSHSSPPAATPNVQTAAQPQPQQQPEAQTEVHAEAQSPKPIPQHTASQFTPQQQIPSPPPPQENPRPQPKPIRTARTVVSRPKLKDVADKPLSQTLHLPVPRPVTAQHQAVVTWAQVEDQNVQQQAPAQQKPLKRKISLSQVKQQPSLAADKPGLRKKVPATWASSAPGASVKSKSHTTSINASSEISSERHVSATDIPASDSKSDSTRYVLSFKEIMALKGNGDAENGTPSKRPPQNSIDSRSPPAKRPSQDQIGTDKHQREQPAQIEDQSVGGTQFEVPKHSSLDSESTIPEETASAGDNGETDLNLPANDDELGVDEFVNEPAEPSDQTYQETDTTAFATTSTTAITTTTSTTNSTPNAPNPPLSKASLFSLISDAIAECGSGDEQY
ncbi:zinc finger CCCH domain-containing protein 11 [Pelomyxa schiedti]|nr:zinc finger CCCH domain-containing protein 11 [Pelomyxa schiedti]